MRDRVLSWQKYLLFPCIGITYGSTHHPLCLSFMPLFSSISMQMIPFLIGLWLILPSTFHTCSTNNNILYFAPFSYSGHDQMKQLIYHLIPFCMAKRVLLSTPHLQWMYFLPIKCECSNFLFNFLLNFNGPLNFWSILYQTHFNYLFDWNLNSANIRSISNYIRHTPCFTRTSHTIVGMYLILTLFKFQ